MLRSLLIALMFFATVSGHTAELKPGRYIGWIVLAPQKEKIAVVADVFMESPEDFTQFPRLNVSFRLNLGGYQTHEYINETFHDLKYDFDNGALTFDEEGNNLLMTTKLVSEGSRTKIMGDVFIRSVASYGKLELWEESDEPGDDFSLFKKGANFTRNESSPFLTLLEGQYEGQCNSNEAILQIQTVRGLKTENITGGLEQDYGISARLAFKNHPNCGTLSKDQWCAMQFYRNGSFNFFAGKLGFQSENGADLCTKNGSELSCELHANKEVQRCHFKKQSTPKTPHFYTRGFFLKPNPEQKKILPDPKPPSNTDLASALRGRFYGYLHNESNNTYMPVRLDVVSFSSTENPHNPNQMMISATASFFLGKDFSGAFTVQYFDPRSFYLRPGFMLSGAKADSIFQIASWKSGYISGIWLSKSFGKVGSFELLKDEMPSLPTSAMAMQTFAGDFIQDLNGIKRWVRFQFPTQADQNNSHTIPFTGSYQSILGNSPVRLIEEGAFDPFTGKFGWMIKQNNIETFGSGEIRENGDAYLFFPPSPQFGMLTRSFLLELFKRGTP